MTTDTQPRDPPPQPFRSDRAARAAISAWLLDGAEIIRRCRIDNNYDREFCREKIADIAMVALRAFDRYRGEVQDPLEYAGLRKQVELALAAESTLAELADYVATSDGVLVP